MNMGNEYLCPVCGITICLHRNATTIHNHYQNAIASMLRNKGYHVKLEFPLNIQGISFNLDSIPCVFSEFYDEKKALKWNFVDIWAKKNKELILLEVEGTSDNIPCMAIKVNKMNNYNKNARVVIFSAEQYINKQFAKKNKKIIKELLSTAEDYSDLNPYIYNELFSKNGLICEYWNENKLKKML